MRYPGPEDAEAKAEHWLREHGITSLPVNPFEIAASLDILVKPKDDAEPGVSGMLLRHRDAFGILYATHIKSIGFQRCVFRRKPAGGSDAFQPVIPTEASR